MLCKYRLFLSVILFITVSCLMIPAAKAGFPESELLNGSARFSLTAGNLLEPAVADALILSPDATITVNSVVDAAVSGNGQCTLREAIANANADSDTTGGDCAPGAGTDTINIAVSGTIQLNTFLPDLNTSMNINGTGMTQTIVRRNAGGVYRIFTIAQNQTVKLSNLTVTNGFMDVDDAAGIKNHGNLTLDGVSVENNSVDDPYSQGGGIYSVTGTLTILNSSITNNHTTGTNGGGIYSVSPTVIRNTTISDNEVSSGNIFVSSGCGGGLAIISATATLVNVTVSGNTVSHDTLELDGGGICADRSNLTIINSTIADNRSQDGLGGGIDVEESTVTLKNTIIADNSAEDGGSDIFGSIVSNDYNFIEGTDNTTITGTTANNITGVDPMLAPLDFNGGATKTHRLLPNSPAIDKGAAATDPTSGNAPITTDQRGAVRPFDLAFVPNASGGNGSDIGAFELNVALVVNSLGDLGDNLPGDGLCNDSTGFCTLRAAIQEINALGSGDIYFSVSGDLPLTSALPVLNANLNIHGTGMNDLLVRRSTGGDYRIFTIAGGRTVNIDDLTVRGGFANGDSGGGIHNSGTLALNRVAVASNATNGNGSGSGVFNNSGAALTVNACYFFENFPQSGGTTNGGAIGNFGTLTVRATTFEGNIAGSRGGAIDNRGTASIVNSTFSNNSTNPGGGGGALHNLGGTTTLVFDTFNDNHANGGSGGNIFVAGGSVSLKNTIVANGTAASGADIAGLVNSNDYNLIEDTNGAIIDGATANNLTGVDPQLTPLGFNGGLTRTHRPLPTSPVLDKAASALDPPTSLPITRDQRGRLRPADLSAVANALGGDGSDIGAYEAPVEFIVNTLEDAGDLNIGDGVCAVFNGLCSLRSAIQEANILSEADIYFSVSGTINLGGMLPELRGNHNILGNGSIAVRRDSGGNYPIFAVQANRAVYMSNLTVTNGAGLGGFGGGIINSGILTLEQITVSGNHASGGGGGIYNNPSASLHLYNSTIDGNASQTNAGGVHNRGTLVMRNSTVSNNIATGSGGGIFNEGAAFVINSTVSGNASSAAAGGGIFNSSGTMTLLNATIASNASPQGGGGGINRAGGTVNLRNTLVGDNTGMVGSRDLFGAFVSNDYNYIENPAGASFTGTTTHNVTGSDPLLGPLLNNGGATRTHRPQPNSPVIDKGAAATDPTTLTAVTTDQRGRTRPVDLSGTPNAAGGNGSDIGAVEIVPNFVVNSLNDTPDANVGNGVCADASNLCTLRAAIQETNALGDNDIGFSVTGTIQLGGALPALNRNINFNAPGASQLTVRRNTGGNYRIFVISSGRTVDITGMTIQNGFADAALIAGGGIINIGNLTLRDVALDSNQAIAGGGISNAATATLSIFNSSITNNFATSSSSADAGGGIENRGTLRIYGSTIAGNASGSSGGGIANASSGSTVLVNSTVSGNTATGAGGTEGGGGIHNAGSLSLVYATVNANFAPNGAGGGVYNLNGAVNLRDTIIANGAAVAGADLFGAFNSNDYNLIENTSGASLTGATGNNITGVDPMLLPLADNGGSTRTHRPQNSSPVIDKAAPANDPIFGTPIVLDQRSAARSVDFASIPNAPGGDGSDIGAFEVTSVAANLLVNSNGNLGDTDPGDGLCLDATGNCTLRAAIEEANASPNTDSIGFAIPGFGPQFIQPNSPLPTITQPVSIDGYTQPLSNPNSDETLQTALIMIVIDGTIAGAGVDGLTISASGCTIRGINVSNFSGAGINLTGANNTIEGSFIGSDSSGNLAQGNRDGVRIGGSGNTVGGSTPAARNLISGNNRYGVHIAPGASNNSVRGNLIGVTALGGTDVRNLQDGVFIERATGNIIGGSLAGERNVISNNGQSGVFISNEGGASGDLNNLIVGNFIGTTPGGGAARGNTGAGVLIFEADGNAVGGSGAGARNVISGNGTSGVVIFGGQLNGDPASNNAVVGNFIGTSADGAAAVGNAEAGVLINFGSDNRIGGAGVGEANRIAGNQKGVIVLNGANNSVRGNSILNNATLGIDLGNDGATFNDTGDIDAGANNLQNFPVLTLARQMPTEIHLFGSFSGAPNQAFTVDFYMNDLPDASGFGEGQTYLGSTALATDASGNAAISVALPVDATGKFISLTATDAGGSTSEFSPAQAVMIPTAANVKVCGQVLTETGGLPQARVTLNDPNGGSRTVLTNGFGNFCFSDVPVGETYVIGVTARRYTFAPQVVAVRDEITGLRFVAQK